MKLKLAAVALVALSFSACTSPNLGMGSTPEAAERIAYEKPTEAKLALFHPVMTKVALSTKEDPNYNKMALTTTEEKQWFHDLMYNLWDRQISKNQFISEGVAKYPSHRYEFTFVANGFQKHS